MINKIAISTEQSQNTISMKEIASNIHSKNVDCIAKFKNRAILKFCSENSTQKCQMFISSVLNLIGIC